MIISITRNSVGNSGVSDSIDTRILTQDAENALYQDLKELSSERVHPVAGMIQYKIEVEEEDGSRRTFVTVHDPNSQWSTPLKRILNETGMAEPF